MSGFITGTLSDAERFLVDQTNLGRWAAFANSPAPKPQIGAALIRHLLVTEPWRSRAHGTAELQWPGVRIRGACIVDTLDLSDCARPGTGLPALVLEDCDILRPLDLGAARLARLSLAGSRFSLLNLREADIDGPFDFSGVRGFGDGDCWIDARGALFAGDVSGDQAKLRAPPGHGNPPSGNRRSALWLAGATIRGNLRLTNDFKAIGSVSLDGASVSGDVTVTDAILVSGEDDAFRAQDATIGGVLLLRDFEAEGVVWLHGLRTGGILQVSEGKIYGDHPVGHGTRHAPHDEQMALIVADAEIGASMRLSPNLIADGLVSFAVAKIRGQLDASGIRLSNASSDGRARALDGTNAEIGASLLFDSAVVCGRTDIAGTRIGGRLSFAGASLNNRTADTLGKALEALNVTVGANMVFGYDRHDRTRPRLEIGARGAHIHGTVDLTGAKIGGDLSFIATTIENPPPPSETEQERMIGYALAGMVDVPRQAPPEAHRFLPNRMGIALIAWQMHVQASIQMIGGFSSDGALLLNGASVGGDLTCFNATLHNPGRSALYAKDIEIGDDLRLFQTVAVGDIRFERASVSGSVTWSNLALCAERHRVVHMSQPDDAEPRHAANDGLDLVANAVRRWAAGIIKCSGRSLVQFLRPHQWPEHPKAERHPHIPRLDFAHARIGTSLKCAHLTHEDPSRIDLTGLHVAALDLTSVYGWGRREGAERHYPINLDLLVYDRLIFPNTPPTHEPYAELRAAAGVPTGCWRWAAPSPDHLADRLLDWLLRDPGNVVVRYEDQNKDDRKKDDQRKEDQRKIEVVPAAHRQRKFFRPQPYRQLARVLRAQGYETQARYIAIAEQWATPRTSIWRTLHGLYGAGFGFGLSPARALVTLFSYVAIGAILAALAFRANLMVETPMIAASTYSTVRSAAKETGQHPLVYRAFMSADRKTTRVDLACRDLTSSDSLTYAIDTVLPFIPLHEETKCEFDPDHHLLRFCRAAYAIVGWIITSLALITFSGILRRFDRDGG